LEPIEVSGTHVLINESVRFSVGDNQFQIFGYDLPPKYFEKFNRYVFEVRQMEEVFGSCDDTTDSFQILLAHNPVYFEQYASWGADLTLSGHLHGGIIRLPFIGGVITPQAKLFPRYSAGKYEIGEKKIIVSRGLGTHTIPIRFNNKPELSVIHLSPAKV
jgi:predicted MPP superfamily phosphohydrolase